MAPVEIRDQEGADGFVRQLLFSADELAVVNVSSEVLTVNWTTSRSAPQFVEASRHLPGGYDTADAVLCTARADFETDADGLIRLTKDNDHSELETWDLVRLDVSETRSVAWERLPDGKIMVGFGDQADCLHGTAYSEAADQLFLLVEMTGTSHIGSQMVVDTAVELTKMWQDRVASRGDHADEPAVPKTATFRGQQWLR